MKYEGTLDLTAANSGLDITGGTTFTGAGGSGAATIDLCTGANQNSYLSVEGTGTLDNATVNLGGANTWDYIYNTDNTGAGAILTLGSKLVIDQSGAYAQLYSSNYAGDGFVNDGAIDAGFNGGSFAISANSFVNNGAINASNGDVVSINSLTNNGLISVSGGGEVTLTASFSNLTAATLTGGTYEVAAGSTLQLANNAPIVTDDADIILSGAGSTIEDYNTSTGTYDTIDATLLTIGASGQLHLLAGRNWTTAGAITNDGQIQLGGGTLTATGSGASLTNAAGARIYGTGTVNATTFNLGLIEASGGTLTLKKAVGGGLEADAGADLVLGGAVASGAAATFNGAGATFTLDKPASFGATIGGIGLDDTIDLVGVTANGASVNGSDQLVVTENRTTVDTLQLIGTYSRFTFLTQAVSGGTDVISLPIPATVADYLAVPTLYDQIPDGFAISDTAAAIEANLGQLDDSHITSITATSGTVTVSCATFLANPTTLDKVVGGFTISDTAANITTDLNQLSDANINSITISDNGPIGVDVAQLTSDASEIGKLQNANATPYH